MIINTYRRLSLAVLTLIFPVLASAQGMCIPTPVEVKEVKGQVFFTYQGNRRPLPDVTVEVVKQSKPDKVTASTTTGEDGQFKLEDIRPGRYWLRTQHSEVIGIGVEMKVIPGRKGNEKSDHNRVIIFALGADFTKSCGGGDVEVTRQQLRHTAQKAN